MKNEQIKQIIGQRVKHYRAMKSLTQKELAAEIGVPASFIANIEAAQKGISLDRMVEICEWFNIGLSDLLPLESQNDIETKEKMIVEMADILRTLETTQVRMIKTIAAGLSVNLCAVED